MKRSSLQRWVLFSLQCVFVAVLLLCLVVWGAGRWKEREWQRYCTEARSRGVRLTVEEFLPKEPVPDAENFAAIPIFQEVFSPQGQGPVSSKIHGFSLAPPSPILKTKPKPEPRMSDLGYVRQGFVEKKYIKAGNEEDDASAVLQGLQIVAAELQQIHEAAQRPESIFPVNWNKGFEANYNHTGLLIQIGRILDLKISAELRARHPDQALSDLNDLLALEASLRHHMIDDGHPYFLSQACHQVWESLELDAWNDAQLNEVEMILARCNPIARHRFALESRRALLNTELNSYIDDPKSVPVVEEGCVIHAVHDLYQMPHLFRRSNQLWANQLTDQALNAWNVEEERWDPTAFHLQDTESLNRLEISMQIFGMVFVKLFEDAPGKMLNTHAKVRMAGLACALERFRHGHGRYPEHLSDLIPATLIKLPCDPCNGEPFRYSRTDDGYLLYSIGIDLKDDGGAIGTAEKRFYDATDWRWWGPGQAGK